tara:strand:+ start:910 stop:2478 length:1569 start_codon:yes stop_codon:yes gene_type:complete
MSGIPLGIMASSVSVVAGVSGATTFTVDTPDEGFAQQLGSFFMKFANAGSISVFSENREAGTTIDYPASMADNDVAVLFQCSFNNASTSFPTKVIPTGFTEIDDLTFNASNEFRVVSAYKKALSTDSSTTITGMNSESDVKFLFIIRGTSNPTVSVGSINSESGNGNLSAQTVTLPSNSNSSDTDPIMVFAVKQSRNDDPLNDFAGLTGSDGFTQELYRQSEGSDDANRVGYYLNNNGRYQSDTNVPVEEIILYCPFNDSTGVASNATVYLSDAGSRTFTSTTSFWSAQASSYGISGASSTTPQIIAATSLLNVGSNPPLPMGYTTCYNGGGTDACIVDTSSGSPSGTWLDNVAQGSFNTLSIEFYFYIANTTQTGSYSRIMTWGDYYANNETSGSGFALEFNGSGDDDFQAHVYDTGSGASRRTIQASNISLSDWHYFYSSVDVVNEECHIRIDNTSTTISTSLLGSTWTPYSSPLKFGQINPDASRGFNGGIAELVIRVNEGVYGGQYRGKTFLNNFITS